MICGGKGNSGTRFLNAAAAWIVELCAFIVSTVVVAAVIWKRSLKETRRGFTICYSIVTFSRLESPARAAWCKTAAQICASTSST
jgi:uncharacterized membrane protein